MVLSSVHHKQWREKKTLLLLCYMFRAGSQSESLSVVIIMQNGPLQNHTQYMLLDNHYDCNVEALIHSRCCVITFVVN